MSMSDAFTTGLQVLLGLGVLVLVIARQLGTRRSKPARLIIMPLLLVGIAVIADHDFATRLTGEPLGWPLLAIGVAIGVVFGWIRAATMTARMEDGLLVTTGNWKTLIGWLGSIATHIVLAWGGVLLGVEPGTADMLLFVAATFAVQNAILASRAGLVKQLAGAGQGV